MTDLATESGEQTTDEATVDTTSSPVKKRRWWLWAIIAIIVVAAVAAAVALLGSNGTEEADATAQVNTATVQRTDVIAIETLDGTLGYGTAEAIKFRSSSDGVTVVSGFASGVVTDIVSEGEFIASGDVLYEVNAQPVVVLEGDLPVYRAFNSRMSDGADVEQLEQALVDLGYDPDGDIEIDEDFTSATSDAIELLQEAIGADETGRLNLGDVLFSPDAVYVGRVFVEIGNDVRAGEPLIATSSNIEGTVTSIAAESSIIGQGDVLLTVDGEPVIVLLGSMPAFRAMDIDTEGDDVLQLEEALASLGFGDDDFVVDGVFDSATTVVVVEWQLSVGASPDGVVNLGDVLFTDQPVRVGEHLITVGDTVRDGTPIATTSVSETFVTVQLSTDDQDLAAVGNAVVVVLPDGTEESAVVTEIGTVVQATQQGATYFEMTVTLDDPDAAPGLDEAPVDVDVISDRADNALAVPVTALLALSEGGYALEVVADDGSTYLIAADPGLFSDGLVEVTGADITDGMTVVVP